MPAGPPPLIVCDVAPWVANLPMRCRVCCGRREPVVLRGVAQHDVAWGSGCLVCWAHGVGFPLLWCGAVCTCVVSVVDVLSMPTSMWVASVRAASGVCWRVVCGARTVCARDATDGSA